MRTAAMMLALWGMAALGVADVAAGDSTACRAAAERMFGFIVEEARGTRHEAQIAETLALNGRDATLEKIASDMADDHCAMLLLAPDSTVRALAIASLPERRGQ